MPPEDLLPPTIAPDVYAAGAVFALAGDPVAAFSRACARGAMHLARYFVDRILPSDLDVALMHMSESGLVGGVQLLLAFKNAGEARGAEGAKAGADPRALEPAG